MTWKSRAKSCAAAGETNAFVAPANSRCKFIDSKRDVFADHMPVAAGPRGQYFVANGLVLNQSLSPISGTGLQPTIAGAPGIPGFPGFPGFPGVITTTTTTRSISAVATGNGTIYARFTQPPAAAGTAAQLDVAAQAAVEPVAAVKVVAHSAAAVI